MLIPVFSEKDIAITVKTLCYYKWFIATINLTDSF